MSYLQDRTLILATHSNAAYLNENRACIRAGAHIFCSDNDPIPRDNVPILSLEQIINVVMSSASEAELAGRFITPKAMAPLQKTPKKMKWPQPRSPIQTYNSTANEFSNQKIALKKTKSMDMRFYWIRCRDSQDQLR